MKLKNIFFFISIISLITILASPANCESVSYGITNNNAHNEEDIIVAERDVVSFYISPNIGNTANVTLILFHEGWVINTGNSTKNITISSLIPKDKDKQVFNYPLFGQEAIMPQSIIQDNYGSYNVTLLGLPAIEKNGSGTNYIWRDVTLGPKEAVIVAYANFYEDGSAVYNLTQVKLPGLTLLRSYNYNNSHLDISFTLQNVGQHRLQKPRLVLFIPEEVDGKVIFYSNEISVNNFSRADIYEKTYYNDGTGKMSKGHMFLSNFPEYLDVNDRFNFQVAINGTEESKGILVPSFIISYIADYDPYNITQEVSRLSPQLAITSTSKINVTKFYYYEVSLAIPEKQFIYVTGESNSGDDNNLYILGILFTILLMLCLIVYVYKKLKK